MVKKYSSKYSANHPLVIATYEMRAKGMSMSQIASEVGLNSGQVWRFLRTPDYDPANKDKLPPPLISKVIKAPPVHIQGLSIKADDGRPVDLQSVTCEKRDGGTVLVISVFVPEPVG
jgi:hypothetical protein